jgi:hypothetical protein
MVNDIHMLVWSNHNYHTNITGDEFYYDYCLICAETGWYIVSNNQIWSKVI